MQNLHIKRLCKTCTFCSFCFLLLTYNKQTPKTYVISNLKVTVYKLISLTRDAFLLSYPQKLWMNKLTFQDKVFRLFFYIFKTSLKKKGNCQVSANEITVITNFFVKIWLKHQQDTMKIYQLE